MPQRYFKLLMLAPAVKWAYAAIFTLSLEQVVTVSKTINNRSITAIAFIAMATGSPCEVPPTKLILYHPNIDKGEGSV